MLIAPPSIPYPSIGTRPAPARVRRPITISPPVPDLALRFGSARGLYRIFNTAGFRFYRSNSAPPLETDSPFATNATLPFQPASSYADGTWYVSVSYFDGVLDSGFLPIGKNGETYLELVIVSATALPTAPSPPANPRFLQLAGGVVQIQAIYLPTPDGTNAGTQWSIGYTTDGTTPAAGSPSVTPRLSKLSTSILAFNLPAQVNGTVVKVQLQTRRPGPGSTFIYSPAAAVLTLTVSTSGPTAPLDLQSWNGNIPEGY